MKVFLFLQKASKLLINLKVILRIIDPNQYLGSLYLQLLILTYITSTYYELTSTSR